MKRYLLSFMVMLAYTFSAFAEVSAEVAALQPGDDASFLGSADKEAWTCLQGNGPNYYQQTGATETWNGSAYTEGKVMYQTISGLKKGTYEIKFLAVANVAWSNAATGANIAQAYCNDQTYDIEVIGQVGCDPSQYERTFMATVEDDGSIEFGLQNIETGGNWYVAKFVSLTYIGNVNPARAEEYADVLNYWQSVNTQVNRWDAEFPDKVVNNDVLNNMNEADKLLVKVFETNFDMDSDNQNGLDLAEARRLIEAAQTAAAERYELLKANKDAYAAINEEIQALRDELQEAQAEIAQNYPDANVTDKVAAIEEKINKLQEDADEAFENLTAVDFQEQTLPVKAEEIRRDIDDLLNQAKVDQDNADVAKAIPAGEYYLQDVATGLFLAPGNNWGTHASLKANPVAFKLASISNAVYTFESCVSNGGSNYYLNGAYCDGAASNIYVTKADDGAYYLSNVDATAYYTTGAQGGEGYLVESNGAAEGAIAWRIVSTSTINAGDNVSFVIKDAEFNRNNRFRSAWVTESEGNGNFRIAGAGDDNGYIRSYEAWHKSFKIAQTIEGLPAGYYTLTAQAGVSVTENAPVVFANNRSAAFTQKGNEGSLEAVARAFVADPTLNLVKVEVLLAEGEALVIGAQGTRQDTWAIWDNFTLTYNGDDATAYDEFVKNSLQNALDAAEEKLDNFVEENANDITEALQSLIDEIRDDIDATQEKIDNATADDEEEILGDIAEINEKIDNLANAVAENQAAYDELMAAYNALKDKWQATYDRINAKYAGMVDNEEYVIKIYRGETLSDEEREQIGAYEKDGAYYVDAFITREDFNEILKGLNKVDYARNLDGYDDENDAIERSYAKGTCAENKENILAEIQKDLDAIDAVWNDARTKHDANVLNANNTNLRQIQKAYETNVAFYKDAINEVNGHLKEWHNAEDVQAANNDLFNVYKAQETAFKDANDKYEEVLGENDEYIAQDLYPKAIFHYEEFAQTLDEDVEGTCQGILDIARAAAVAENAEIYADELEKAQALLDKIDAAQAVVDTYAESVKTLYTATLDAKKQEVQQYINETLAPYDNEIDDPCIKEDQPTIDAAIEAFDQAIDQIAEDAAEAEEKYQENEAAFADIKAQIEAVLDKLTEDRGVIQELNDEDEEPRAAVAEALSDDLYELLSEAEASKDAGTSVADKDGQLEQLAELSEDVDEYFNNALLDVINAKADAAAAYLAEVKEVIETYADAVKAIYLPKAEAIAQEIADLKEAAKADWDAGELVDTYQDYIDRIGEKVRAAKGLRKIPAIAGTDDFATLEPSDSYLSGATTAGWAYENAAIQAPTKSEIFGEATAVCINGKTTAVGSIVSPVIEGGIATLSLNYAYIFNENNGVSFNVALVKDGQTVASKDVVNTELEKGVAATATLEFNVTDAVKIVITNNSPSQATKNADRYSIWGISWTAPNNNPNPNPDDPDAQTIYEEIEALKIAAAEAQANEEAYAEIAEAIEAVEEKLADAKEAIESSIVAEDFAEQLGELEEELEAVKEDAAQAYADGEADDQKQELLDRIQEISNAIDELLDEVAGAKSGAYREQLAKDFDALKTYWNVSYAATSDADKLAELDRIYNEITEAYHNTIEADLIISDEIFEATEAKIEELTLAIQKTVDLENYLAEHFMKGDPDGDGKVSVNDVVTIIDFIINDKELTVEEFYMADVNGDGFVNILDITTAINIILETPAEGNDAKTRAANNDYLVADGTELSLINTNAYTTFQMDITVADGATLNDIVLADRADGFQVAFGQISDNTYRVVVASLQNRTIMGNEGLLINLDITGDQDVEYSNVLFSDVYAHGYVLPIISDATAIAAIKANIDADCQIYTLGGAQVNGLQKGINIVKYADGSTKKLFVK
ncbi:MAG: hypothetical protein IJT97_09855 [Bacteroidaceae bacterium]|nr:hypothetical protein [Bacteroidaceae bacterium]